MQEYRQLHSKEEIDQYGLYFQNNHTLQETADHFNVAYKTLINYLIKYGYYTPKRAKKKITKNNCTNPSYFEIIDSDKKAYLLGFLMSDGYICSTIYNKQIGIALQLKDRYILEAFRDEVAPLKALSTYKNSCKIVLNSDKMYNDLFNYGFRENKSHIDYKLPNIPDRYMNAFIRGYFDGDGCITIKSTGYSVGSIVCNSKLFLEDLANYLILKGIITRPICKEKRAKNPLYVLYLSGRENQLKFANYIYKDATLFLKRKYEKFMKIPR